MNESFIQSYEPEDKVLIDSLIGAMKGRTTDFSIASESSIATTILKQEAVRRVITAFKAVGYGVVATSTSQIVINGFESASKHLFAIIKLFQRHKYCSIYSRLWTGDNGIKTRFEELVKATFEDSLLEGTICGIRWAYTTAQGLQMTYIEEYLADVVHEEAYPGIVRTYGSLDNFVNSFADSDESILVLQGPPGTGKSRLIRYIMANMARRKTALDKGRYSEDTPMETGFAPTLVLYTSDTKALTNDELFARFITGDEPMFIIEDADHIIKPRASGNDDLHRFLSVSDGIIKNVGRKIIFTTNLPNIGDLDDALIRPGRCFARVGVDYLTADEAAAFAKKLAGNRYSEFTKGFSSKATIAEVYKAWNKLNQNK